MIGLALLAAGAACGGSGPAAATPAASETAAVSPAPAQPPTVTPAPSRTATGTPTPAPSATVTATTTVTPTVAASPTPAVTATPTITPTYAILRGEVLQRSNCRYGPGPDYLYKYGLVVGSNLEVIGRTEAGDWILVRAIGGDNPCWVKATLMAVRGDVMAVAPTEQPLPLSPYYGPPAGVLARREGDEVTVFWNPIQLRAGDETASPLYLLEAWVCRDGQLVFTPIGSDETFVKVADEAGCAQPSHGRVYGVEKHGYTLWVKVPWPAHE